MTTARELLQQADALMRRNRPGDPGARDADIPELTDAIAVETAESVAIRPGPSMLADVPELTDAVEEIEAPSVLEMPDDPGEPSQWLEVDRGEASITGAAPDSILAVPASTFPSWSRTSVASTDTPAPPEADAAPAPAAALASPLPAYEVSFEASPERAAPPEKAADETPTPAAGPEPAAVIDAVVTGEAEEVLAREGLAEDAPAAATEPSPPSDAAPESAREVAFVPAPIPDSAAGSVEELEPSPASEHDLGPAASPAASPAIAADETERWNSLAEEIRMQVLQRIDIFTDTGLQKQLSARLQPIVDRASADLVATINHQVGQLLRAYVAEAIEREIEKWRQGGD